MVAAGLVACGQPMDVAKDAGPGGGGGGGAGAGAGGGGGAGGGQGTIDAGVLPRFDADPLPPGATLFLKADLADPKAPKLEVWAQGLSPVLGLAFHLGVDGAQLRIDSAGADPVMGFEARYLQKVRGADVAFGLAHLGAVSGETDLTVPTRIAVVQLTALTAVDARPLLTRVQARKADGTFVPLKAVTGKVVLP